MAGVPHYVDVTLGPHRIFCVQKITLYYVQISAERKKK